MYNRWHTAVTIMPQIMQLQYRVNYIKDHMGFVADILKMGKILISMRYWLF